MEELIENKIAKSGLITIDLDRWEIEGERVTFDIADYLFQGLILKEKDFRAALKEHNWQQYEGKFVAIECSADAIVQPWAAMLVSTYLQPHAMLVVTGNRTDLETAIFLNQIQTMDINEYIDGRIIIKGCSKVELSPNVYTQLISRLQPAAKSIMYGEPCSTVPLWKNK